MGLDMYLYEEEYLSEYFGDQERRSNILDATDRDDTKRVMYEVGYWRKANAIHNWFVQNVQGGVDECQRSYVPIEKLEELRDTCLEVIADPEMADELLPPTAGFFFGSTSIDEWYINDLKNTVEICDKVLNDRENDNSIYYQSSW